MKIPQAVYVIEKSLGIKLSKEQLAVLNYNNQSPILTDACAGSGKTTLMLINVLVLIITGQAKATDILCITFSKAAQLNMLNKYKHYMKLLKKYKILIHGHPYFTTFHALFLRIINRLAGHRFPVIASWKIIKYNLAKRIKYKPVNRTQSEVLKDIFNLYNSMINDRKSYNGLELINTSHQSWKKTERVLDQVSNRHHMSQDKKLYDNYRNVIKTYNRFKNEHGWIDFNDMKTKLFYDMRKPQDSRRVHKIMEHFRYSFIDEFQDIDKLQWKLVRLISSRESRQHMMVIGDDDQSIYAFRGGDPDIMLNFRKEVNDAKIFHLSTNYRTGGRILDAVKPLIRNNKYRYNKKLLAAKRGQGEIKIFRDADNNSYNDNSGSGNAAHDMFDDLSRKIKNPKIPNSQIVVLVRYNTARMFVINWLASHKHYIHVGSAKRNILQNNYVYKIFYQLIEGISDNRFLPFYKNSTRIGFHKYKEHINAVISMNGNKKPLTLSKYLSMALGYNKQHQDLGFTDKDDVVKYLVDACRNRTLTGAKLWKGINSLTKTYFNYMINKEFMRSTLVYEVQNTFKRGLTESKSIDDFMKSEQERRDILNNGREVRKLTPHPVNVLSLHQSKGLEFQYVYLYGLTDRQVKPYMVHENKYFAPNIIRSEFLHDILNFTYHRLNWIDEGRGKEIYSEVKQTINQDLNRISKKCFEMGKPYSRGEHRERQIISKIVDCLCSKKVMPNGLAKLSRIFEKAYITAVRDSRFVEEERRLIYVGVTRAEKATYICKGKHANPLLDEILLAPSADLN